MKKTLRIYESFEEQKTDGIRDTLALSPQERIRRAVELTLRAYGTSREELKNRKRNNQIKVIYYKG